MTDPLRTDRLPESGEVPERDRDARVEHLLVAGLDHYFAGQHELAISVWTRVLFLDRGHARAKAYIDRARGAIAERLREGDELLHTGAAAFDRGDAGTARDLLESAVERSASSDEALALLGRLNRLEPVNVRPARAVPAKAAPEVPGEVLVPATDSGGSSRAIWIATGVLTGLAVAGVVAWVALTRPDWLPMTTTEVSQPTAQRDDPLPVPASSEIWLSRARTLYEDGRLRDALAVLDGIGQSDPLKADADELRAAIQRTLLDAARVRPAPAAAPGASDDPTPPRQKPPSHPS
jgi:hypothetical protein